MARTAGIDCSHSRFSLEKQQRSPIFGLNNARLVRKEERACLNETPIEIEETKETKARP